MCGQTGFLVLSPLVLVLRLSQKASHTIILSVLLDRISVLFAKNETDLNSREVPIFARIPFSSGPLVIQKASNSVILTMSWSESLPKSRCSLRSKNPPNAAKDNGARE